MTNSNTAKPRRLPTHPRLVLSATLALALLAGACGSTTDETADAASAGTTAESSTSTTEATLGDEGVATLDASPTTTEVIASEDSDVALLDENSSQDEIFAVWAQCMADEGITEFAGKSLSEMEQTVAPEETPAYIAAQQVCDSVLEDVLGSFELDPAMEAELADRSVKLAECGREILPIEIPDDVLFLEEDDPRMIAIDSYETTPEQDAAIEACFEQVLGDLIDENGELITDGSGAE